MGVGGGLGQRFWWVWTAGSVSSLGDGVIFGALPLLAASITRDPRLVSLVDAVNALGWLLLGLVSGVVVDRVDRLGLMWRVDAFRTVVGGVFAAVVLGAQVGMVVVLAVSLVQGLAAPFFDNAASAVVPELVDDQHLEQANSTIQLSLVVLFSLIGPPLGAILFVAAAGAPFVIDAVSFAAAAVIVAVVAARRAAQLRTSAPPEPSPATTISRGMWADLREGLTYLVGHRNLMALAIALLVINMVSGGVVAVLVLFVLEVLKLPEAAYGWLIAVYAVGGIGGSLLTPALVRRYGQRACTFASIAFFVLTIAVLGLSRSTWVIATVLVVGGFASVTWAVVTVSYRQRVVPRELLGRVTSVYRVVGFLAIPLGAAGTGVLAHAVGIQHAYLIGAGILALTGLLVVPRLRELPGRATPEAVQPKGP